MRKTYDMAKKVYILIGIALILSVFFTSTLVMQSERKSDAIKTADLNSAEKAGNGADLWNSNTGEIDYQVVSDLVNYIFGEESPSEYVEKNGRDFYDSKVLQGKFINDNIHTSNGIVSNNNGIVVNIGGYTWMVTSLAKTLPLSDGEEAIVATLYLSDPTTTLSIAAANTNTLGYGAYCDANTRYALTTDTAWSLFQNNTAGDFAEQYLVQPKYISYQLYQNYYDFRSSAFNYTNLSDALVAPRNETSYTTATADYANVKPETMFAFNNYVGNPQRYDAWGEDYIWLPSAGEVGHIGTVGGSGCVYDDWIWGITNEQRMYNDGTVVTNYSPDYCWLRSGANDCYYSVRRISASGGATNGPIKTDYCLRPAIHLNLSAIGFGTFAPPEKIEVEYTGSDIDLDEAKELGVANWYNSDFKSRVTVTYYKGQTPNEIPNEPGAYTIKLKLNDSEDYWRDGTTGEKTITFTVIKRKLPYPKWDVNGSPSSTISQTFNGSNGRTFELYYDSDFLEDLKDAVNVEDFEYFDKLISVTVPTGVTKKNNDWEYSAIDAKTYDLTFTLNDTDHYQWKDEPTSKKLSFTVSKKTVTIELTTGGSGTSNAFVGKEGSTVPAVLDILPNQLYANYNAVITIRATRTGSAPKTITSNITLTDSSGTEKVTLNLADVSASSSTFTLSAVCSSAEYNVVFSEPVPTLKVEEDNKNVIRWQLRVDGVAQSGYYIDSDIEDPKNDDGYIEVDFATTEKTIYYTGKYTEFKASAYPQGYALKTSSYNDGYQVVKGTASNNNAGVNADTYTTYVDVYKLEDNSVVVTFIINWEIAPALFDLSKVVWANDGDLQYNGGQAVSAVLDEKTLPKGLVVPSNGYSTNQGSTVGNSGTASVEFELDPAYEGNYILPVKGDKTTYLGFDPDDPDDPDDDFEWEKAWQVVPKKISTSSWSTVAHPDSDKSFNILQLKDPSASTIVSYLFYETDSNGQIPANAVGLSVDELEMPSEGAKWYVAKPSLTDTTNYVLENPNAQSRPFMVGAINASILKITVEPAKTEFSFNTQPRQVTVKTTGANLNNGYFDLYYFKEDGFTSLSGAPVNCGTYWVEITLKSAYTDKYIIEGTTSYQFTIVPAEIIPDWKMTAHPPVLNLEYGQINAIEYTIIDDSGNVVANVNDIVADKVYQIKATIREEFRNNIQFSIEDEHGSIYDTDYITFSLSADELAEGIYDPNDPLNPYYPQVDPDAPNTTPNDPNATPSDGDGKKGGSVDLTKVKEFLQDYWQPIVCGVSIILILAFTAKGMSYASKRRKIKKEIKKKYTPAYALALFTAGEKLWGIEYKIWTILAFTLVGVAVLSMLYMLLEKRGYKHAQEQLADAKEEYARNPMAFATAPAMAGTAGSTTTIIAGQPYAEDSKASRKKDREIERLEEELRKRDEEDTKSSKKRDKEVERLEEELRKRDEEMKMMFMSMLGNANAGANVTDADGSNVGGQPYGAGQYGAGQPYGYPPYGYAPYGMPYGAPQYGPTLGGTNITIDAEHIKGIISETVSALLPGMQAMLPQQAGTNDEVVKLLAEESRKNNERVEMLISKLLEKDTQPAVVTASANDKVLEQLAKNQELLVKQIQDLKSQSAEPKVIEKVVEKPVEKIVEKKVEVPVEKVVEKVVEKPVEKIVEKIVEKPVEKIVEVPITVEKLVEVPVVKEVPIHAPAEKSDKTDKKKSVPLAEKTPRLTIDEAYAKLSKEQKKFFDGLREYALAKDKCKEKKLTYNILLGQSSVNPLVKLTIKKDMTVALFKMEDEYFKDIRRNAEGQKIKVKESELIVADAESF